MNPKIKYGLLGAGLSVVLFIAMGIPAALVPNPLLSYIRMIPATWLDYFFLAATSVLLGTLIALKLYFRAKEKTDLKTVAGGLAGFFAFSCPICNVLLVSALGTATVLAFVEPLRPFFGFVAVVFLSYLVHKTVQCRDCRSTPRTPSQSKQFSVRH